MTIRFLFFLACALFMGESLSQETVESHFANSKLVTSDCLDTIGLENSLEDITIICGDLVAPENYQKDDGRLINIPYLIAYKKDFLSASNSPLVITGGGGPGGAYLKSEAKYPFTLSDFEAYFSMSMDRKSMLIVLENRGAGHTDASLGCPEIIDATSELYKLSSKAATNKYHVLLDRCINRISSNGIDISQYHVENAAKDLELLRLNLESAYGDSTQNFKSLNLYGISYGTRVALYYEMLYPDSTRSMVLDSAVTHVKNPITQGFLYNQISFDLLFERCMQDSVCNHTYGANLEEDFYKYLNELQANPTIINAINPKTLKPEQYVLDTDTFLNTLTDNLYSYSDYTNLPYVIRTVVDGSTQELSRLMTTTLAYNMGSSLDEVAFYSYLCFDNSYEPESLDMFKKYPKAFPLFNYTHDTSTEDDMFNICKKLNMPTETEYLTTRHTIDTPVLLLSGKADTITPPNDAKLIRSRAKKAWLVEWDNVAHHVISHLYCPQRVAEVFLNNPTFNPATAANECYVPTQKLFYFVH